MAGEAHSEAPKFGVGNKLPQQIMRTDYIAAFAQVHAEFRIPELLSVAELFKFTIHFVQPVQDIDTSRPFMIFGLDEEEHAKILAARCILLKYMSFIPPRDDLFTWN